MENAAGSVLTNLTEAVCVEFTQAIETAEAGEVEQEGTLSTAFLLQRPFWALLLSLTAFLHDLSILSHEPRV